MHALQTAAWLLPPVDLNEPGNASANAPAPDTPPSAICPGSAGIQRASRPHYRYCRWEFPAANSGQQCHQTVPAAAAAMPTAAAKPANMATVTHVRVGWFGLTDLTSVDLMPCAVNWPGSSSSKSDSVFETQLAFELAPVGHLDFKLGANWKL